MNITFGADPEVFLHNGTKFISSVGKVGGSKEHPLRILGGFCLQEDNVSVEFNIPPVKTADEFVMANHIMLEEINHRMKQYNCETKIVSSAEFDDTELSSPEAQVFGCDPDFNAWELEPNPRPHCDNKNLRSAGGHIHIGIQLPPKDKILLVRTLDMLVGAPLAVLDCTSQRRELYGRAGACRLKAYGVEYRTPSNIWLTSKELTKNTIQTVQYVTHHFKDMKRIVENNETTIQNAINTLDPLAIYALLPHLEDLWPPQVLNTPQTPTIVTGKQIGRAHV